MNKEAQGSANSDDIVFAEGLGHMTDVNFYQNDQNQHRKEETSNNKKNKHPFPPQTRNGAWENPYF